MNVRQSPGHAAFLRYIKWETPSLTVNNEIKFAFVRKLPLLPLSVMKIQRLNLSELDFSWINQLERKYRVFETYIELDGYHDSPPQSELKLLDQGFKPVNDFLITSKTRILDLTLSESELLNQLKPKTRYNLGLAKRKGLVAKIINGEDLTANVHLFDQVYDLLAANAKRINFYLLPRDWIYTQMKEFGVNSFVVVVTQDNSDVFENVALFLCSTDSCFYHHNGSTEFGRRYMAPTLTVWQGILEGKRQGKKIFDFDGVFDERIPRKRWQGFTRFKSGFGGKEVYFPLMYRRFSWPW